MVRGDALACDREASRSSLLGVGSMCLVSPGLGCSALASH